MPATPNPGGRPPWRQPIVYRDDPVLSVSSEDVQDEDDEILDADDDGDNPVRRGPDPYVEFECDYPTD